MSTITMRHARMSLLTRTVTACTVCLVAAMSLSPAGLHAQAAAPPRFGALLGASLTTISDADLAGSTGVEGGTLEAKRRIGFQLGAYFTKPLSQNVSLQPEVHFIQKGTKAEATITDAEELEIIGAETVEAAFRLTYLEVPLLLRVDMGSSNLRPFIVAGPSVAYRVACKVEVSFAGLSLGTDCDEDDDDPETPDDPFKKYDVGGIIGLGVASTNGGRALSAQVRYSHGLVSIARESIPGASPRNTGISILFGIGF